MKCQDFYNIAISTPNQEFNWYTNAFVWFGYLSKPGENILNEMQYKLDSKELKTLARQLQTIEEAEFGKLKLRIEGQSYNCEEV